MIILLMIPLEHKKCWPMRLAGLTRGSYRFASLAELQHTQNYADVGKVESEGAPRRPGQPESTGEATGNYCSPVLLPVRRIPTRPEMRQMVIDGYRGSLLGLQSFRGEAASVMVSGIPRSGCFWNRKELRWAI